MTELPTIYQPWDLQHLHYPKLFSRAEFFRREREYRAFCDQASFVCVQAEWTKQDIISQYGIGAEKVRVTPLGLLAAYRRMALERRQAGEAARTHEVVFRGLEAATRYGTAQAAQPPEITARVAGKTGTARADEGQWTHGWFAGFAPSERPEVVLVVFLEKGTGPADAAPLAGKIFAAWWRERGR